MDFYFLHSDILYINTYSLAQRPQPLKLILQGHASSVLTQLPQYQIKIWKECRQYCVISVHNPQLHVRALHLLCTCFSMHTLPHQPQIRKHQLHEYRGKV